MLIVQLAFRNSWKEMVFYARVTISTLEGVKGSHVAIKVVNSSKADTHYLLFCHLEAKNCQLESDDWWSVSRFFWTKGQICIKVVQTSVLYFVLSIPEFAAFFFDHLQVTIAWRMPCLRRVAWPWSPKRSKNTEGNEGESWGFQLFLVSGIHQWSESGHCRVAWRKGCSKKRLILKSSSCSGNDNWVSWKILNLPMWRYLKDMTSWHVMVSNDPLPVRFPLFNLSWGWKGLRVFRPQMRALEAENHLLLF